MPLMLKSVDLIAVLTEVISEDLCLVFRLDIGVRARETDTSIELLLMLQITTSIRTGGAFMGNSSLLNGFKLS